MIRWRKEKRLLERPELPGRRRTKRLARRDLVDALLDAGALYSLEDVEHRMDNYMKGRVK